MGDSRLGTGTIVLGDDLNYVKSRLEDLGLPLAVAHPRVYAGYDLYGEPSVHLLRKYVKELRLTETNFVKVPRGKINVIRASLKAMRDHPKTELAHKRILEDAVARNIVMHFGRHAFVSYFQNCVVLFEGMVPYWVSRGQKMATADFLLDLLQK